MFSTEDSTEAITPVQEDYSLRGETYPLIRLLCDTSFLLTDWVSWAKITELFKGGTMVTRSSHPLLSHTDGIATGMVDVWLLIGRVLIALVFLMTVWTGGPAAGYLKSLNYPAPEFMSVLAHVVEWIVVLSLILGIGARYGALLGLAFVVIAFATAHRYWEFPETAQNLQYVFLSKDLAIAGGLLVLFVTGAGRLSIDSAISS
jgi:putative oxidoreductase